MVGVGQVGGVDIGLTDEQLLFIRCQIVPVLEQVRRPRRQLRIPRNDAELLLVDEYRVPKLVPATIEEVHGADFINPLWRRVMRRMGGTWSVIAQKRLRRI